MRKVRGAENVGNEQGLVRIPRVVDRLEAVGGGVLHGISFPELDSEHKQRRMFYRDNRRASPGKSVLSPVQHKIMSARTRSGFIILDYHRYPILSALTPLGLTALLKKYQLSRPRAP